MLSISKIGGTSMSKFEAVLENVINYPDNFVTAKKGSKGEKGLGRIYVVSAYSGVTNLLLEHKKTGKPGIYENFVKQRKLKNQMEQLLEQLKSLNKKYASLGLDVARANDFIEKRVYQILKLLQDLASVLSSGYVEAENIYLAAREVLASIGEVHSAYNSFLIVASHGYPSEFLDLSGFGDSHSYSIDERIAKSLKKLDLENKITFVTGYVKGVEGIMREFDRGYSEITFSKICTILKIKLKREISEAVIFKEYHLSSADPMIVGSDKVVPVGITNYDVADQLADVGMEAIHPKASKPLEAAAIDLRVKNTFDPTHSGTLVTKSYRGKKARVEIITGSNQVMLVEIHDPKMVGEKGFDLKLCEIFSRHNVSYIFKSTNANSISQVIWQKDFNVVLEKELKKKYYEVTVQKVAIVCVLGTNIAMPGVLASVAEAFNEVKVNVKCMTQSLRQVNMQFVINRDSYDIAIKQLNKKFFKK